MMNEIIIDSNGGDGNWANDFFSGQNLIGVKEPNTESDILAKTKAYEYAFYSYGLLPLLLLLDEYIELERYYECYCIKTAIDNINFKYKQNLETVYGKKAVDSVKEYYDRQKKDFSEYLQRVPFYVREVFQFVNKKINPIT